VRRAYGERRAAYRRARTHALVEATESLWSRPADNLAKRPQSGENADTTLGLDPGWKKEGA
jgi:hypothetical protein